MPNFHVLKIIVSVTQVVAMVALVWAGQCIWTIMATAAVAMVVLGQWGGGLLWDSTAWLEEEMVVASAMSPCMVGEVETAMPTVLWVQLWVQV